MSCEIFPDLENNDSLLMNKDKEDIVPEKFGNQWVYHDGYDENKEGNQDNNKQIDNNESK